MNQTPGPIVFGPVPSRRLGRSLGVSTIPPKVCSYSCAYCQVGRTTRLQADRGCFYEPSEILSVVEQRLRALQAAGERVDYVSLVPDGEPTLDLRVGDTIELIRQLGIPVAVITNGSLLHRDDVRRELAAASWVSVKVDAARERTWRRLNRPHRSLGLEATLDGILRFRKSFGDRLVTETMVVAGVNDAEEDLAAVAAFLRELEPAIAYVSIPIRPPAERWVQPAGELAITRAHELVAAAGVRAELLTGSEGLTFSGAGEAAEDLLAITAVHPMRRAAVTNLLERDGAGWEVVRELIEKGSLVETSYGGEAFYLRRFARGAVHAHEIHEKRGEM